jgi:hypothetical protein
MLEVDLMRMTLIVGVALASVIYAKTRLLSGGLMTGAYLALLVSQGDAGDLLGWAVIAVISFLVIKLITYLVALPKAWILSFALLTSAIVHGTTVLLTGGKGGNETILLGGLEVVIAGGMYITPGLTAYSVARQGWLKTTAVVSVITGITLIVTLSVAAIGNTSAPSLPLTSPVSVFYTNMSFPLVMMMCIAVAEVMRVSFGLGSGGIIGAVFFVELIMGDFSTFFVVIALVTVTVLVAKLINKFMVMTPLQSFQFTFLFGSVLTWVALNIGATLGLSVAEHANEYALEPLLTVALISSDLARFGIGKTSLGNALTLSAVILTNIMFLQGGVAAFSFIGFEIVLVITLYMIGFIKVVRGWDHARMVGEQFPLLPGTSIEPTFSDSARERRRKLRRIKLQEEMEQHLASYEKESKQAQ